MKKATQLSAKKRDLWRSWTPQEWVQGLECMYWYLLESQHKTGRNHFKQLLSLKITLLENKILVLDHCLCLTEIKKGKPDARKKLLDIRATVDTRCDMHLEIRAKEGEKVRGGKQAAIVRKIWAYEHEMKVNNKL